MVAITKYIQEYHRFNYTYIIYTVYFSANKSAISPLARRKRDRSPFKPDVKSPIVSSGGECYVQNINCKVLYTQTTLHWSLTFYHIVGFAQLCLLPLIM